MRYLTIILAIILLSGCSAFKAKPLEVNDVKIQYITIPEYLLIPCTPDRPITKEEYLKLEIFERETYLSNYSIGLLKVIKNCNIQLDEIRILNNRGKPNDSKP